MAIDALHYFTVGMAAAATEQMRNVIDDGSSNGRRQRRSRCAT